MLIHMHAIHTQQKKEHFVELKFYLQEVIGVNRFLRHYFNAIKKV